MRLKETPGDTQRLNPEMDTPSDNSFPRGSNSKGKVKLSSEQIIFQRGKLMVAPIDNRGGSTSTLYKEISLSSLNDKIKVSLLITKKGVR